MQKYYVPAGSVMFTADSLTGYHAFYDASDVDARIAELERMLDIEQRALVASREQEEIAIAKLQAWEAEANRLGDAMEAARVWMRGLWRLEPGEMPSEELAQRCKAFMGGG